MIRRPPRSSLFPYPPLFRSQAKNEFYRDDEEMALDFAAALNAEAHELAAAGADVIQLDEPWLRNDPERSEEHTSELQSPCNLVCRLLLEKKQHHRSSTTPAH